MGPHWSRVAPNPMGQGPHKGGFQPRHTQLSRWGRRCGDASGSQGATRRWGRGWADRPSRPREEPTLGHGDLGLLGSRLRDHTFLLFKQPNLWYLLWPPRQTNMPAHFLGFEFVCYRIYEGARGAQHLVDLEISVALRQSSYRRLHLTL